MVAFPEGALEGLKVERKGTGAVLLSSRGGKLRMRINGDSLLMMKDAEPLSVSYTLGFEPATVRQFSGNSLLLDEYGGIGSYAATGPRVAVRMSNELRNLSVDCGLAAEQVLWLSVAPPKPYDWEASFGDRVVWHWSRQTGYPTDPQIEEWRQYGNLLLQQSEVMLWKDWSLRFIPRNGIEEFERVNRTCERLGMRNFVYTSPFYFLTGTGKEDRAMNSFDNFEVTGFSPGDGRGLNWPIFLAEIKKVVREYKPDGLYFDGIYSNVVRTYLIARKAREVVGEGGILEYHATGSPPGGGVYVPQIDTYFNFILRGEGRQSAYENDDYLRYFVSTYNISNSIGVLCNNNNYELDEAFIGKLLDNNIRLHLIPGWLKNYRKDAMEKLYWPALNDSLKQRVAAACERRSEAWAEVWARVREAAEKGTEDLEVVYEEDFEGVELAARAPAPPPDPKAQRIAPKDVEYLELPEGWRGYFSANNEGGIEVEKGLLRITGRANTCAYLERELPDNVIAVQCKVRGLPDCGASWGPGLLLRTGDSFHRINVRSDNRIGIDRAEGQLLLDGFHHSIWYWVRMHIVGELLVYQVSGDGQQWQTVRVDSIGELSGNKRLLIGKIANNGANVEWEDVGPGGTSYLDEVRAFASRE